MKKYRHMLCVEVVSEVDRGQRQIRDRVHRWLETFGHTASSFGFEFKFVIVYAIEEKAMLKEKARDEMMMANFPEDEIKAMEQILNIFFDTWDSGGAVSVMQPVLMRLIAGKPLKPLTGEGSEWVQVDNDTYQNVRCSSVFKKISTNEARDIDSQTPDVIKFPYWPSKYVVPSPIVIFGEPDQVDPNEDQVERDAPSISPKL